MQEHLQVGSSLPGFIVASHMPNKRVPEAGAEEKLPEALPGHPAQGSVVSLGQRRCPLQAGLEGGAKQNSQVPSSAAHNLLPEKGRQGSPQDF